VTGPAAQSLADVHARYWAAVEDPAAPLSEIEEAVTQIEYAEQAAAEAAEITGP
jgi:hypothetical protein